MKTTSLKTLALLLLVLFTSSAALLARGGRHHGLHSAARSEIRAYVVQNVLPVLRQQRQKLEPRLSPADRAQLATYRTRLQALRRQGQTLRQSLRPEGAAAPAQRPELTDAQKQQFQQLRTDTRTLMESVGQLAQKYEADITKLTQEVQPQQEKWAADIKALVAKDLTPEQQQKMAHFGGRMGHHNGIGKHFRPAAFLLLDPKAPAPTERDLGSTSVFPNPAVAASQLDYEVQKAGPVTVELLDGRGNALRTVAQEAKQEKGAHSVQVNVSDLPNGTYYYKITTKSGSETRRFVKE